MVQIKEMMRLIADDGKLLSNGNRTATVVDCPKEDVNNWSEIVDAQND